MTSPKRPLLPREDRQRLRSLAAKAARAREESGTNQAYAQGVVDTLKWIVGDDAEMAGLLQEVTR